MYKILVNIMNKLRDDYLLFQIIQHTATLIVKLAFCFLYVLWFTNILITQISLGIYPFQEVRHIKDRISILRKMGKHNKKFIRFFSLFIKLIVKSFTACTNLLSIKEFVTWP